MHGMPVLTACLFALRLYQTQKQNKKKKPPGNWLDIVIIRIILLIRPRPIFRLILQYMQTALCLFVTAAWATAKIPIVITYTYDESLSLLKYQ